MKLQITLEELAKLSSRDTVPCVCESCGNIFYRSKHLIDHELKYKRGRNRFCDQKCFHKFSHSGQNVICLHCGTEFYKITSDIINDKHFCSKSCAVSYNNTHKTKGNRRSVLEKYFEEQLPKIYPQLEFHFNRKDAINSELDVYIPALKLAFELNGIFHYEPIYGSEKLQQIQSNDQRKFQACIEHGIELCIIDASALKYFKPERAKKYLDIVCNLINNKSKNVQF